jgi:hypothetical protein
MMYWILLVMGTVVSVITAIIVGGFLVPKSYTVTRSIVLAASSHDTHAALLACADWPIWMELTRTPHIVSSTGHAVTVAIANDDRVTVAVVQCTLAVDPGGTRVTATDSGEIANPVVRLFRHYVSGHQAIVTAMLVALAASVGDTHASVADA